MNFLSSRGSDKERLVQRSCFMESIQGNSAGQVITQAPETSAGRDAYGTYSERRVSSQPCCPCSNRPPPPYEEAIRPARSIPVTTLVYKVNETEKMLRSTYEEEQRQRAKERGCCEAMMSDGGCGELTKICCYVLCCIPYLCLQGMG